MKKFGLYSLLLLSTVALADNVVDGSQLPTSISRVYSYSCTRRFLEGEGIGSWNQCPAYQHLGFLTAQYKYYLFESEFGNNFDARATTALYDSSVCGLTVDRYTCDDSQVQVEFGLASKPEGRFVVAVQMPPSPDAYGVRMGYAASPDREGNCAEGLVKIQSAIASPASVFAPLPSNFVNNGSLNAWTIRVADRPADLFQMYRIPAKTDCGFNGVCEWPAGEPYLMSQTPFMDQRPILCALPVDGF